MTLVRERQYFSEHLAELIAQHLGKFVVIRDDELIGTFNTIEDALAEGARRFGLTPFLVRQVTNAEEKEINIPALTLGILRADSSRPVSAYGRPEGPTFNSHVREGVDPDWNENERRRCGTD